MYAEIAVTVLRNQNVLHNLPSEVYAIEDNGRIPDDCRDISSVIQAAQN